MEEDECWLDLVSSSCNAFQPRRTLADSGEGYSSESECLADIDRVKNSSDAPVVKK